MIIFNDPWFFVGGVSPVVCWDLLETMCARYVKMMIEMIITVGFEEDSSKILSKCVEKVLMNGNNGNGGDSLLELTLVG